MNAELSRHPQLLSLLEAAREAPEDDSPRLIIADWLEEHGAAIRAEFLRLQCRLTPGGAALESKKRKELAAREQFLLSRYGCGWLGPLWQWWLSPLSWHRGLLAVQLPRGYDIPALEDVIPWIDTALFRINGARSLHRAVTLLARLGVNHLCLDLRQPLREEVLLRELARVPESPCLRSLTVAWPYRLLRHHGDSEQEDWHTTPAVSDVFLRRLLVGCPFTRHLTHLASTAPFDDSQAEIIRSFGVEPAHAEQRLWMHEVSPACFRAPRATVQSAPQETT